MRSCALLVVLLGCGRFGFDAVGDGGAGSGDGGLSGTPIAVALPAGGEVDHLTVASDGRWYAVSAGGAVYRSDDNQTWVACGDAHANDVAVAADGRVFISGADVLESTDHCATWQPTSIGRFASAVATRDNRVFGLVDNGLRELVGTTWTTITTPLDGATFRAWSSRNGAPWLLGTNAGLMHSADSVTWQTVGGSLPSMNIVSVATSPTKTYAMTQASGASLGGVGCSDGTAATWSVCAAVGGTAIAVDPANDSHVFAAIYDNLFETTNAFGTSTAERRGGAMGYAAVEDVTFLPDSSVLAATDRGVFVAPAGTIAWQARYTGLEAWTVSAIARTGDELYLATTGGVIHGIVGQPYTHSFEGMADDTQVNDITVTPDGTALAFGRHIWSSHDHGATWNELLQISSNDGYRAYAVTLVGTRAYAGTAANVYVSDPPYTTWTPHALGHIALGLVHDGTTLWVATDAGLFRSPDDGVTFQQVSAVPTDSYGGVAQLADGGLVVGDGSTTGTWISDPTRTTWQKRGPARAVLRVAEAGGAIIASTDVGIYASHDRGMTWVQAPATASYSTRQVLFDPADGQLVVGTVGHGLVKTAIP